MMDMLEGFLLPRDDIKLWYKADVTWGKPLENIVKFVTAGNMWVDNFRESLIDHYVTSYYMLKKIK